jgi:5-methylcytosine-specific restriction endonuclease McrA
MTFRPLRDLVAEQQGYLTKRTLSFLLQGVDKLPRGPNGRRLCRWCGTEVPADRRCWCSQQCVDAYLVLTQPSRARQLVEARDHGICALCGLDCPALVREMEALLPDISSVSKLMGRHRISVSRWMTRRRSHLWDMDHIVPVSRGGGCCGLDNLRTLCIACHKRVTAEMRRERRKT